MESRREHLQCPRELNALSVDYDQNVNHAYKRAFKEVGGPMKIVMDGARAPTMVETGKFCKSVGGNIVELKKETPASNQSE